MSKKPSILDERGELGKFKILFLLAFMVFLISLIVNGIRTLVDYDNIGDAFQNVMAQSDIYDPDTEIHKKIEKEFRRMNIERDAYETIISRKNNILNFRYNYDVSMSLPIVSYEPSLVFAIKFSANELN